MSRSEIRFGCIEAGGTKFNLAIGDEGMTLVETERIPTTTPKETLDAVIAWFDARGPLAAMGVASFGPVDLDRRSPTWGCITRTPKPGWSGVDLAPRLGRRFNAPVGFDTDVNGAALAEVRWGAAKADQTCVYITVGTGIGGGVAAHGQALHGRPHPELGHALARRHPDDQGFAGVCPFHGDCFEGLASGPAIAARWGAGLSDLPADHPGHALIAWYVGQLAVTVQAMLAPERILLGGGVMHTPGLLEAAQQQATALGGGYFDPRLEHPALGDKAGLLGGLALAQTALKASQGR